jgi:tetratricopeptide (TPR) repeat protein
MSVLKIQKFVMVFAALAFVGAMPLGLAGQSIVEGPLDKKKVDQKWKRAAWEFDKAWSSVTDEEEAKAWGIAVDEAFKTKKLDQIKKFIDFKPMHGRCVAGITNESFKNGFSQGIVTGTDNLLKQLAGSGGSYVFRGVKNTNFGACALMRMLDANGGCNYHLWRLQKNAAGDVQGIDMYIFLSGETFADTMRRITLLSVPKDDRTFFQKLSGVEQSIAKHQQQMLKLFQATQAGDFEAILAAYDALPNKLKSEKSFMVMRMTAAMQADEAVYLETLEAFQKQYPGDVSAALMGLDLYFIKKQFPKMYDSLDVLTESVGEDAHLEMLRAIALNEEGKLQDAVKVIKHALTLEPKMEKANWTYVELELAQKDFPAVTNALKQIVQRFGYTEFAMEGNEAYAEYIKTPEHEKFQAYLKTVRK